MDNKYYIPTIEEFYVGFEYEYKHPIGWKKEKMSWESPHEIFSDAIFMKTVRVPYISKEDIESLGWKYDKLENGWLEYKLIKNNKFYTLFKTKSNNYIVTLTFEKAPNSNNIYYIFKGKIKNKSELKKLMEQLGIK
jgi:hypothetical protein